MPLWVRQEVQALSWRRNAALTLGAKYRDPFSSLPSYGAYVAQLYIAQPAHFLSEQVVALHTVTDGPIRDAERVGNIVVVHPTVVIAVQTDPPC